MIKFFLKKGFYDLWDNYLAAFAINVVYALFLSSFILLNIKLTLTYRMLYSIIAIYVFLFCLLSLLSASLSFSFTNYEKPSFKAVIKNAIGKIKHFPVFFLTVVYVVFNISCVIPYFLGFSNALGIIISVMLFWIMALITLSLQYYYPLAFLDNTNSALKILIKALAYTIGNKGFTLFVSFRTLFDLIISIPTAFIIPGFAGISTTHAAAVKILLIKYDYMRENKISEVYKEHIKEMLDQENLQVGERNLKNTFFPWKKDYAGKRKTVKNI